MKNKDVFLKKWSNHTSITKKDLSKALVEESRDGDRFKVEYFIENMSVNFNKPDETGCLSLCEAVRMNRVDIVSYLATFSDLEINTLDGNGFNALHYAANINQKETMSLLLDAGANVNAQTLDDGQTIGHILVVQKQIALLGLAIRYGLDLSVKDLYGRTVLDYALEQGSDEIIGVLKKVKNI